MKTTLSLLFALHLCSLSAQNPCIGCWGQNDSTNHIVNTNGMVALKWYDFSTYKFKGNKKRWVWGGYLVAGVLHGGREAYHAESTVFEKRFGVSSTSFFGSEQWKRNYYGNSPELPHKPNIWNTFRDYYHFSSTAHTTILVSGAVLIGTGKQPTKYKVLDALIAITIRSAAASLTYNALR
jgi:hypothetical protein